MVVGQDLWGQANKVYGSPLRSTSHGENIAYEHTLHCALGTNTEPLPAPQTNLGVYAGESFVARSGDLVRKSALRATGAAEFRLIRTSRRVATECPFSQLGWTITISTQRPRSHFSRNRAGPSALCDKKEIGDNGPAEGGNMDELLPPHPHGHNRNERYRLVGEDPLGRGIVTCDVVRPRNHQRRRGR